MKMEIVEARSRLDYEEVYKLTYDSYVSKGLCKPTSNRILLHSLLGEVERTTILMAREGGEIVGTISITEDVPLHTEISYLDTTSALRRYCSSTGKKLGGVWRLVSKNGSLHDLIDSGLEAISNRGIEIVLSVVHPRHVRVYERLLGFMELAWLEKDPTVNNAKSSLIVSDYNKMIKCWRENNE